MPNVRNTDFIKNATIITNPVGVKGAWSQILCLSDCSGVNVVDKNLTPGSEQWSDSEFLKTAIIVGEFREVTLIGKVVLYA